MRYSRFDIRIDTEDSSGILKFYAEIYSVEDGLICAVIHKTESYTYEYDAIEAAKEWIHETQRGVENE